MANLVSTYVPIQVAFRDECKAYLGVSGSAEDANLDRWLDAACYAGDAYLGNPFVDDLGVDVPIPEGVEAGVFEYVGALRRKFSTPTEATEVKTAQLSVKRDPAALKASPEIRAARPYWRPHAKEIWLKGDSA